MELREAIERRFSVRKYLPTEVQPEMVNAIIQSALLAPSAKNRQPWIFKVLTKEEKDTIAKMMLDYKIDHSQDAVFGENSVHWTAESILQAPVMILILRQDDKNWLTGDLLSIGAAIEHMLLTATDMGLGSLWIRDTVYVEDQITEFIGRPDLQLVSAVIIGQRNQKRPKKWMKPNDFTILS